MPIDPAEATLAHVGLTSVLKGTVKHVGVGSAKEITDTESKIAELAGQLMAGSLPQPKLPREHSYAELLDRLSKPLSDADLEQIAGKFSEGAQELLSPFLVELKKAYEYLQSIFPISEYATYVGPVNLVPDSDAVWMFFLKLQMLNDPYAVFPLMGRGALLKEQADVVRVAFPTLAEAFDQAIHEAAIEAKVKNDRFHAPWLAEQGIMTWSGKPLVTFDPLQKPPLDPRPKRPASAKQGNTLETTGDKAESPGP